METWCRWKCGEAGFGFRLGLHAPRPHNLVIPTGAGAPATAEWRNLLFLCATTLLARRQVVRGINIASAPRKELRLPGPRFIRGYPPPPPLERLAGRGVRKKSLQNLHVKELKGQNLDNKRLGHRYYATQL